MSERDVVSSEELPAPEGSRFGKAHHILLIFAGLALLAWLYTAFYVVNTDQVAIVERLGTYLSNGQGKAILMEHGLHYGFPWPIDRVHKISIQQRRTLALKTFYEPADSNKDVRNELLKLGTSPALINALFDPYLITGDKNVVHVELAIQYNIDDPEAWLNTISHESDEADDVAGNREEVFREIAQHALTEYTAASTVDHMLFNGQAQIPADLRSLTQKLLTVTMSDPAAPSGKIQSDMGVQIQAVDLVNTKVPDAVQGAFNAVGVARAQAASQEAEARGIATAALTDANAKTVTYINDAKAYQAKVVNAATGEAERFRQVYEQYQRSPDVTRWNVYVDAVKEVTKNANRIFFAQPGQHVIVTVEPPQFDVNQVPK